jgi:hypothetical protein
MRTLTISCRTAHGNMDLGDERGTNWGLDDHDEHAHSYQSSNPASGTRLSVACRPSIIPALLGRSKT